MNWLTQLFTRRRRYDELSESIREHLEEKIADLMDRGMTREQAEHAAHREFGNVTLIEKRSREVWQWPSLESIGADVKFALRDTTGIFGSVTVRVSCACRLKPIIARPATARRLFVVTSSPVSLCPYVAHNGS